MSSRVAETQSIPSFLNRLRHLPHRHASRRPQAPRGQGLPVRQAQDLRCRQGAEAGEEPPVHRRGARRTKAQGAPRPQLVLGRTGQLNIYINKLRHGQA